MKTVIVAGVLLLLLTFLPPAAALSCAVSSAPCAAGVPILNLFQRQNSHAELPSGTTYPLSVCCSDPVVQVGGSCTGIKGETYDTVVNLYAPTNSHVQQAGQPGYQYPVCLSGGTGTTAVSCLPVQSPTCPAGSACIASLAATTNAHVAQCGYYPIQICCSLSVDQTPPAATIQINNGANATNAGGGTSAAVVTLSLTFDDPESGIANPGCQYSNDGATYSALETCASPKSGWALSPGDGTKTVFFRVFNTLNTPTNVVVVSDTITVDTVPPTITFDALPPFMTTSQPSFSGDASDTSTAIVQVEYRILNATNLSHEILPWTPVSIAASTHVRFSFTAALGEGRYSIFARAADDGGNLVSGAQEAVHTFLIDSTPPVTTDNTGPGTFSSYTVLLACTDNLIGCKDTVYCVYDSGSTPCTPDTTVPASPTGAPVPLSCPSGQVCKKTVRYASSDLTGNQEQVRESASVTLDMTQPSCSLAGLPPYQSQPAIALSWTASDPQGKPIQSVTFFSRPARTSSWQEWNTFLATSAIPPFPAPSEGGYEFHCTATNTLGVTGFPSSTVSTIVDTTPPRISLSGLASWTNDTKFIVSWLASDALSGIRSYDIQYWQSRESAVTPATTWTTIFPPTSTALFGQSGQPLALKEGNNYTVRVLATDNAGLTNISGETSTVIDLTEPTCAIAPPSAVTTTPNLTLNWSGSDSISGIATYLVEVSNDSAIWKPLSRGTYTSTAVKASEGETLLFRCLATDKAGNTGNFSATEKTTFSTRGSSIQVVSTPSPPLKQFQAVRLNVTVSDADTIWNVTLNMSGATVPPSWVAATAHEWNLSWTFTPTALGITKVVITVWKQATGQSSQEFSFSVVECLNGENKTCGSGIGECGVGSRLCTNNQWGACTGGAGSAMETCNGLDDDCDVAVDNGLTAPPCQLTAGICAGKVAACLGAAGWSRSCGPAEYGPEYETTETRCDGKDNDCDGQTDEDCGCTPGEQMACGSSDILPCAKGIQTCSPDGSWGLCQGAIEPAVEVCGNQRDDNCDSRTDEDCSIVGGGGNTFLAIISVLVLAVSVIVVLAYEYLKSRAAATLPY